MTFVLNAVVLRYISRDLLDVVNVRYTYSLKLMMILYDVPSGQKGNAWFCNIWKYSWPEKCEITMDVFVNSCLARF